MERTSRRNLLRAVAAGSAAAAGIGVALRTGISTEAEAQGDEHSHAKGPLNGPLANAVVSFGHWKTVPALDRFPNITPSPAANVHLLFANAPTIKAGGAVSFIISGLHNVQVFEPGIEPGDINIGLTTPMTAPPGLPIINDPVGRVNRRARSQPAAARPSRDSQLSEQGPLPGDLRLPVSLPGVHVRLREGQVTRSVKL